jgi:hypothetical protein
LRKATGRYIFGMPRERRVAMAAWVTACRKRRTLYLKLVKGRNSNRQ